MSGVVQRFGVSWNDYVTSQIVDNNLNRFVIVMGVFYLLAAFSIFLYQKFPMLMKIVLFIAVVQLIFLSLLLYKELTELDAVLRPLLIRIHIMGLRSA